MTALIGPGGTWPNIGCSPPVQQRKVTQLGLQYCVRSLCPFQFPFSILTLETRASHHDHFLNRLWALSLSHQGCGESHLCPQLSRASFGSITENKTITACLSLTVILKASTGQQRPHKWVSQTRPRESSFLVQQSAKCIQNLPVSASQALLQLGIEPMHLLKASCARALSAGHTYVERSSLWIGKELPRSLVQKCR